MPQGRYAGSSGQEGRPQVDFYVRISEVIDFRSFSNLWFWIALAVMWSTASHWVMGVPWDLVQRARRQGGRAGEDVHQLACIYAAASATSARPRVSGSWHWPRSC